MKTATMPLWANNEVLRTFLLEELGTLRAENEYSSDHDGLAAKIKAGMQKVYDHELALTIVPPPSHGGQYGIQVGLVSPITHTEFSFRLNPSI